MSVSFVQTQRVAEFWRENAVSAGRCLARLPNFDFCNLHLFGVAPLLYMQHKTRV